MYIKDDRKKFFQWDINQKIVVENEEAIEVHFTNTATTEALICEIYVEDGLRVANVPNILLQDYWNITAFAVCDICTREVAVFEVEKRAKPTDYVYTETEVKTWDRLEEEITNAINSLNEAETNRAKAEIERNANEALRQEAEINRANNVNKVIASAEAAITETNNATNNAITATEGAVIATEKAQTATDNITNTIGLLSNAVKGKESGSVTSFNDVSPIEHEMKVTVSQSGVTVKKYGLNVIDSDTVFSRFGYVKQDDGSWLGITRHGNQYAFTLPAQIKGTIYVQATAKNTGKKNIPLQMIAVYTDGTKEALISLAQSHTDYTLFKKASAEDKTVSYIMVSQGGANENIAGAFYIRDFMISYTDGNYEPYKEPITYTADENGIVSGVTSLCPSTTLIADTEGVVIESEYNKDINKVIDNLTQAIKDLGGKI